MSKSKLTFSSMYEEMAKLNRQMKILEKQKSQKAKVEPEEPEESDEVIDEITNEDDDFENIEVHSANDIDDDAELPEEVVEDTEEPEVSDELEPEEPIEETIESTESVDENVLNEKLDKFIADFNKFKAKSISMLEAILAANRISIGLDKTETPRLAIEKKTEGTLNTASGKLKHEVAGLALWLNPEDMTLKVTTKTVTISKGDAVEQQLEVKGKIPTGNWVIIERHNKYTLVSTDNCTNLKDVEPYDDDDNNESGSGIIVNKKGVANNVRGYELEPLDDCYKLTERALKKPVKVFKAKWNSECDNKWPVKGNVPEGTWVIVYSRDSDGYYLVESDDVEVAASTKKTEEKKVVKKVPVKKVVKVEKESKKPVKKIVKKVAKRK